MVECGSGALDDDLLGGINDSMGEQLAALYAPAGSGNGDDTADVA